jgi:hypothetical protein
MPLPNLVPSRWRVHVHTGQGCLLQHGARCRAYDLPCVEMCSPHPAAAPRLGPVVWGCCAAKAPAEDVW